MSNPTKVFSEFVSDIQFSDLSSELIDIAKIPILDGFANMMAGSTQEVSGLVSQYVQSLGGNNQSTVIGHNYQTSTLLAAFINGVSGHCLDYEIQGHPATHGTSSCLPSALALGENRGIKTASGGEKTSGQLIAANPNSLVEKMFNSAIEKKNDQSPNKNKPIPDILESSIEPLTMVKTVKKPPVDYDIPFWPSTTNFKEQFSSSPPNPPIVSEKSNKKSLIREKNAKPKLNSIKKDQAENKRVFPTWKHELQTLLGLPKPAVNGIPSLMSFNELKALLQTQSGINDSIFMKSYKEVGFDDFQKFLDQNSEQIINFIRNSNSRTL